MFIWWKKLKNLGLTKDYLGCAYLIFHLHFFFSSKHPWTLSIIIVCIWFDLHASPFFFTVIFPLTSMFVNIVLRELILTVQAFSPVHTSCEFADLSFVFDCSYQSLHSLKFYDPTILHDVDQCTCSLCSMLIKQINQQKYWKENKSNGS